MIRLGVDAGGTFTDCVAVGEGAQAGFRHQRKLPSRPEDPAAVVMEALDALLPRAYDGPVELVYSTTAATNALLTRQGGPVVLFTTAGFEDVLEIARQTRPELYALEPQRPTPLVSEADRLGVDERMDFRGQPLRALGGEALTAALAQAAARPSAHLAICFLHAHRAPGHEAKLAAALRGAGRAVSVSSEICPLPREYERTSTTVIDAYVTPALGATLARVDRRGLSLRVMESSGGARKRGLVRPARTVLSGPAAGVIAVEALLRSRGVSRAVALDIGGTSTDVAWMKDGRVARVDEIAVGDLPIALPSLDVRTIGAGGGSVAWIDDGGALRVGPQSAGARPGPAAYGLGGEAPTLTDAHVVLGRLGATICGGTVALDAEKARAALTTLAEPLGVTVEEAAAAIVWVAEAKIVRAMRAACGAEPVNGAALVAYGGACGLHAVALARELGLAEVIAPTAPGLLCARGALAADLVIELPIAWRELMGDRPSERARARLKVLGDEVDRALEREAAGHPRRVELMVRARYEGQGIDAELELPIDSASAFAFADAHERAFGYRLDDRAVELVRLEARGRAKVGCAPEAIAPTLGWSRLASRRVWHEGAWLVAARHRRARLPAGARILGPALLEEDSATLWLPPHATATVEPDGALRVAG